MIKLDGEKRRKSKTQRSTEYHERNPKFDDDV
jgi:hypothetical protein